MEDEPKPRTSEHKLSSWEDFLGWVAHFDSQPRKPWEEVWYRGQSRAKWPLDTTLERRSKKIRSVSKYLNLVREVQPAVETFTGHQFLMPDGENLEKICIEYDGFEDSFRPLATYLAHLRHGGFPSPLLDWTVSPYVAAYFAFHGAKHDGEVAIFAYQEWGGGFKIGSSDDPHIVTFGPNIKTHKRHFRQQSRYTTCVQYENSSWHFQPHESVFGIQDHLNQDRLWKFTLPTSERMKVLKFCDKVNLTAFTLFDSEEGLLEQQATPPQMVLRALCDWAVGGGFPAGSFIDATGNGILPIDIYMSFRAVFKTSAMDTGITVGNMTVHTCGDQWGQGLLSRVLVTSAGVLSFCDRTRTLPPPSLLSGLRRWWAEVKGDRSLAPPMCPHADKLAAKTFAHQHVGGLLGTLEGILRRLKEGHRRVGLQKVEEGPIDFEFWGRRWRSSADAARMEIGNCEDAGLLKGLESLESQWTELVAANSAGSAQSAPPKAAASRRPAGRPVGSGSLNASDAPLVEEMREAILDSPGLSPTSAARRLVDRAAGGGTEDSKVKRLTQRYLEKFSTETVLHAAD